MSIAIDKKNYEFILFTFTKNKTCRFSLQVPHRDHNKNETNNTHNLTARNFSSWLIYSTDPSSANYNTSHLILSSVKCLRSLLVKQCRRRSDCFCKSSLIWVTRFAYILTLVSTVSKYACMQQTAY